ncbi:MAG: RidA family protein [Chloroflexi bacterium]|nr:RidA family protein [Chloroflexota bacterium]MBM3182886.1 RidA family protein [Chloroflexota bacterium]MBM4451633.1 RidA family protein [Chloroflexota bacterium]MBM4454102.1 RidA family protein [Chloroflexota bacterium]
MKKIIYNVDGLSKGGPYSHVVEAGGFLFVSGVIPMDIDKESVITDNIQQATKLVLNNIKRALASVGSNLEKVVKVTVFLRNMDDFNSMNEVYKTFFSDMPPARSCVAVKGIPANAPIEMEVIAIK